MGREGALITRHPLLIQKTMADKLSDKVQVIIAPPPADGSFVGGNLVGKAMEALGRNPEAQPVIQTNMILGIAFAEAIAIYALVVAVMIGFVF